MRGSASRTEDASVRTVAVAVAANLLVAAAKAVAALLTGSAAILAETTHSASTSASTWPARRTPRRRRCSWRTRPRWAASHWPSPALVLHILTGSAVWDGAASLLIGRLLIGVA